MTQSARLYAFTRADSGEAREPARVSKEFGLQLSGATSPLRNTCEAARDRAQAARRAAAADRLLRSLQQAPYSRRMSAISGFA